ncbi:hypothetical protein [Shinella sp.]|uniref:hypothetical protein n=1 Tax=Shinella sp. TaxID=1870904 RepID=UPI004036C465
MSKLRASDLIRLRKLLLLLSSDKAGEVLAAAGAIRRTLEHAGCSFHELGAALGLAPEIRIVEKVVYRDRVVVQEKIVYRDPPVVPEITERKPMCAPEILSQGNTILDCVRLSAKERNFIENITAQAESDGSRFTMTAKQIIWFNDIAARYWGEDAQ